MYVGSSNGFLYAFDANAGTIRWIFDSGRAIYAAPTLDAAGRIYFPTYFSTLGSMMFVINPSGALSFNFSIPGTIEPVAMRPDGGMIVSTYNTVQAYSNVGAWVWTYTASANVTTAAYWATQVFFGTQNSFAIALNAGTGSLSWSRTVGFGIAPISAMAVAPDGSSVYFTSLGLACGHFITSGTQRWCTSLASINPSSGLPASAPAVTADNVVYVGVLGVMYALNGATGAVVWSVPIGGTSYSPPSIGADGTVYMGTNNNQIVAVGAPSRSATSTPSTTPPASVTQTPSSTSSGSSSPSPSSTITVSISRGSSPSSTATWSSTQSPTGSPSCGTSAWQPRSNTYIELINNNGTQVVGLDCVVPNGYNTSSLPTPSFGGWGAYPGRCWFAALLDAQAVCVAFGDTCCGITYDGIGFEPRGPLEVDVFCVFITDINNSNTSYRAPTCNIPTATQTPSFNISTPSSSPGPTQAVCTTMVQASQRTLSAGAAHTCAVGAGGAVICWGVNSSNQSTVNSAGGATMMVSLRTLRIRHHHHLAE